MDCGIQIHVKSRKGVADRGVSWGGTECFYGLGQSAAGEADPKGDADRFGNDLRPRLDLSEKFGNIVDSIIYRGRFTALHVAVVREMR
jgi:hypothetical protein